MMKKLLMLLLVVGCVSTGVFAQDTQPAKAEPATADTQPAEDEMKMPPPAFSMDQPQAGSLLKAIPSDCMGYIAATNVKGLTKSIERLTRQLGFGEQLDQMAPGGLLSMAAMFLQLGEGYNPNGGLAVVIPNMEKLGYDPAALGKGEEPETDEIPMVILVAGKSDIGIFPQAEKLEDGGISIPGFPLPVIYTSQIGDYVAFSPSQKALDLMKGETLDTTLGGAEKDLLTKNDVAVFYNLKILGPFIAEMADSADEKTDEKTAGQDRPFGMVELTPILKLYGTFLKQMDALAFGIKLGEKGISCNFYESVKPDTELAKVLAAYKPSSKPLMNRLPNLPYVLAFGASMAGNREGEAIADAEMQLMKMVLKALDLDISEDLTEKIIKTSSEFNALVTSQQLVAGPANGEGLFGVSMVLEVTDSQKAKALLPTEFDLMTQLVQSLGKQKQVKELESLKFSYVENADTINDTVIDVIEVTCDELTNQSDDDKAEMKKVLGEDKILIRVAQVDPKTLVITFGGGKTFMATAIDSARKGGTIDKDPNVKKTLAELPANPIGTMIFSPQNLLSTERAGFSPPPIVLHLWVGRTRRRYWYC